MGQDRVSLLAEPPLEILKLPLDLDTVVIEYGKLFRDFLSAASSGVFFAYVDISSLA
jgi:hypothetical protein